MRRAILSASMVALLAACDGNPLDPIGGGSAPFLPGDGGADNTAGDTCSDTNVICAGEANRFVYNPGADEIEINNLPFDLDGVYERAPAYDIPGYLGYTNQAGGVPGGAELYIALYREGTHTEAGLVATDGYANFGFGAVVMRSDEASFPSQGEAIYQGPYAGIRVSDLDGPPLTRVTGTARLRVDFEDFDFTGAIDGSIFGRVAVDAGNAALPPIGIATTGFDGIQIETTEAAEIVGPTESGAAGTFSGIFGGNMGPGLDSEIAGIIILEGPNFLNDDYRVLERGAFVIPQTEFNTP